MKVYLAGPMSGVKAFNVPAFDAAAENLRARGYEVVSPAELDDPRIREAELESPDGNLDDLLATLEFKWGITRQSWGKFLARDVELIADEGIEAIVCLPGWQKSRGARLETFVGRLCELPIAEYGPTPGRLEAASIYNGFSAHDWDDDGCAIGDPGDYMDLTSATIAEQDRALAEFEATGETRVVNKTTGGEKGTKPQRMELLPYDVLMRDVSPLYAAGAKKYADHNYRKGYDWSLSFGALMRHATQFWHGEEVDEETGCAHLASVVFHALALLHFTHTHPELDDRP